MLSGIEDKGNNQTAYAQRYEAVLKAANVHYFCLDDDTEHQWVTAWVDVGDNWSRGFGMTYDWLDSKPLAELVEHLWEWMSQPMTDRIELPPFRKRVDSEPDS